MTPLHCSQHPQPHKTTIEQDSKLPIKPKKNNKESNCSRKMWFMCLGEGEDKELGRQKAPGSCPYCGGKVEAMDVDRQWRFCFLPMCSKIKRKYFCTQCARRLELYY
ncbi:hypothetical protein Lalb_Chr07g0180721 [Lupinus albus]|uniref:Uncharacterized protein n=1 Tax=Lupinus albus TaxID=3870 RepID=A0A6A4Q7X0_LUPAL|nr:hypothetical protein Lalb_Chr07g0180721 [Lupinus albus]